MAPNQEFGQESEAVKQQLTPEQLQQLKRLRSNYFDGKVTELSRSLAGKSFQIALPEEFAGGSLRFNKITERSQSSNLPDATSFMIAVDVEGKRRLAGAHRDPAVNNWKGTLFVEGRYDKAGNITGARATLHPGVGDRIEFKENVSLRPSAALDIIETNSSLWNNLLREAPISLQSRQAKQPIRTMTPAELSATFPNLEAVFGKGGADYNTRLATADILLKRGKDLFPTNTYVNCHSQAEIERGPSTCYIGEPKQNEIMRKVAESEIRPLKDEIIACRADRGACLDKQRAK